MLRFATAGEYLRNCDEDAVRKVATVQPTSASSSQGPDWSQIDWSQQERVARSRLTAERAGTAPASRPSATRDVLRGSLTAQISRERRARGTAIHSIGCLNRWGAAEARQRGWPIVRPALPPSLDAATRPLSARPLSSQWEMTATYQMGARALADMPLPPPPASSSSAAFAVPMDTFPAAAPAIFNASASAGPSSEASVHTVSATWHGSVKARALAPLRKTSVVTSTSSVGSACLTPGAGAACCCAAGASGVAAATAAGDSPRRSRLPAQSRATLAEQQMLLMAELDASQQEREELDALETARRMEAEADSEENALAKLAGADRDTTEVEKMMDHESAQEAVVSEKAPAAKAAKAEEQAVPDGAPSAIEADAAPQPSSVKFGREGPDGTQLDSTPRPTPPPRDPRALAPSPLLCRLRATVAAAAAAGAAAAPRGRFLVNNETISTAANLEGFGPDGTPIDPETVAEEEAVEEEAETVLRAPEAAAAAADAAKAARAVAVALRAAAATREAAHKKAAEAAAAAAAAEAAEAALVAAAAAAVRAETSARHAAAAGGVRTRVVEAARARLMAEAEAESLADANTKAEVKAREEAEAKAAAAAAAAGDAAAEYADATEPCLRTCASDPNNHSLTSAIVTPSVPFPLSSPLGIAHAHPAHAHAIAAAVPPAPPTPPVPPAPPSFAAPTAYALTLVGFQKGCPPHCRRRHPMHLPQRIELPSVAGSVLTFGRADGCDVQLDSLLYPTMISRKHARLVAAETEGTWIVDDCGAANGTHVNGQSVGGASKDCGGEAGHEGGNTQVAKRARVLQVGDVLCFGTMRGRTSSDAVYRVSTL